MKKLSILLCFLLSYTLHSQTVELVSYVTGLNAPVDITNAGDDRLFVVEKGGRIKIVDATGAVLPTPFLNISNLLSSGSERGLLGLAFHPDYANNGYFFVNYTNQSGDTDVVRYSRDSTDPNLADPASDELIINIDQTQSNHNGGCIKFGPDGYLYIAMGDGGGAGDVPNNSQTTSLLLGKMLRLDVDNGLPYTIPADNPFVGDETVRDEIWAIGLRNPWRFSFDRMTGDMWIGDVGQNAYEEIDFQPASSTGGENYGWRCYEGDNVYNTSVGCTGTYTFPAYVVPQTPGGPCSITGGFVYRGSLYPELIGAYIFADFCSGDFYTVVPDGDGGWTGEALGDYPYSITSFGEGADGELYCAHFGGRILRVTFDACSQFNAGVQVTSDACDGESNGSVSIAPVGGTPPYTIAPMLDFDNLAAGDYTITISDDGSCNTEETFTINSLPLPSPTVVLDGNELSVEESFASYQWLLNDVIIPGATNQNYLATESGVYNVEVTAANGCINTSDFVSVMVSDLATIAGLEELTITPNPFGDNISLSISVAKTIDFRLAIMNLNGETIFESSIKVSGQATENIQLEQLPAGVYYLRLSSDEGSLVREIVKQ